MLSPPHEQLPPTERLLRSAAAALGGAEGGPGAEVEISRLATGSGEIDRGARALASTLAGMSGLERSHAVCELATAARAWQRAVAALCLRDGVPVIGAAWCIEQLACDPDPTVRRLAALTAQARRAESADGFAALLDGLTADSDHEVALAARRARAR